MQCNSVKNVYDSVFQLLQDHHRQIVVVILEDLYSQIQQLGKLYAPASMNKC